MLERVIPSPVSSDKILMLYRHKAWELKGGGCIIFFILNLQQLQPTPYNCYLGIKSGRQPKSGDEE